MIARKLWALALLLLLGAPALGQNPTCPTRPLGDDTNACASTAFVKNWAPSQMPSVVQGDILYGSAVDVISTLAKSTTANRFLSNAGSNNNPQWTFVAPQGGQLFQTYALAQAATVDVSINTLMLLGYTSAGDLGLGAYYTRVASEPASAGKLRTTDRFLPNGSTDNTNGGWWVLSNEVKFPGFLGATGDGVTDDRTAILNWISLGGNLQGQKGSFVVTNALGTGWVNGTVMDGRGVMEIQLVTALMRCVIDITNGEDITIKGMLINGRKDLRGAGSSGECRSGISIASSLSMSVMDNTVYNTTEHCIDFSGNALNPFDWHYHRISNNYVYGCGHSNDGDGIWVIRNDGRIIISNNLVIDSVGGITVDEASSGGTGAEWVYNVSITGNVIQACSYGIRIEGVREFAVTGNTINVTDDGDNCVGGSDRVGIWARDIQGDPGSRNVAITGNSVKSPQFGIQVRDVQNITVSGNAVNLEDPAVFAWTNGRAAIDVFSSTDGSGPGGPSIGVNVTGNTIRADGPGIRVGVHPSANDDSQDVSINNNVILYNGPTIVAQTTFIGIHTLNYAGLRVNGNTTVGFYINQYHSGTTVTGVTVIENNTARAGVTYNYSLDDSLASTFRGNVSSGATTAGILFDSTVNNANTVMSGNSFTDTTPASGTYTSVRQTSYNLGLTQAWLKRTITYAASVAPDWATFTNAQITLTGNLALDNGTNLLANLTGTGILLLIQDGTGGHTITYGTDYEFTNGSAIVLSTGANAQDVIGYQILDTGRVLLFPVGRAIQ